MNASNMNIINRLTLRHIKENKSRALITIAGVFISVIMITVVIVGMASFLNFYREILVQNMGHWHAQFYQITEDKIKKLKEDERIETVGLRRNYDNKTDSFQIKNAKTKRLGTGTFFVGDEEAIGQIITGDLQGSIPKNDSEIIVSQDIIDKNDFDWKIGDTVTLDVGVRYKYVADFTTLRNYFRDEYITGEQFDVYETKELKIVGILGYNHPTKTSGSIIRGLSNVEKRISNVTIVLKNIKPNAHSEIKNIAASIGIKGEIYKTNVSVNDEYLSTFLAFDDDSSTLLTVIPIVIAILIIIMAASIVLIYNAFGMSLSERTRYLGMLASVGATKKQKKASVYYESFILGIIAIPLGIAAGILGVFALLKFLGNKIISTGMLTGAENLEMKTVVPLWAIGCVIIVSAVTIVISAAIPAKRASAITPIDAIRQNNDIKINPKRLKSSKLIRKIFGYEGELANKNLKRNGAKAHIITASIALSVILFLSVNYFCDILIQSNQENVDCPYQVSVDYSAAPDDMPYEKLKNELSQVAGVDRVYSISSDYYHYGEAAANPKRNEDFEFTNQDLRKEENLTDAYKDLWDDVSIVVHYVDDEDFNALCKANNIDYKKYYDKKAALKGERKCVVLNNISYKERGPKVFTDHFIGEKIYEDLKLWPVFDEDQDYIIGWETYEEVQNQITYVEDFVEYDDDNYLFKLNRKNLVSAYVPISMHEVYFVQDDTGYSMAFGIETSSHKEVIEPIGNVLDDGQYIESAVYDNQSYMEQAYTTIFVLQVLIYGFIILIILITIANIVNTISTGIDLRRKEFAMLKSVGITSNGFVKLICFESLFYALRALVFAIPLSVLISYVLNVRVESNTIAFEIDYLLYAVVIAAVFAIIGLAMLLSVSKLKKATIIDTLKEDIS